MIGASARWAGPAVLLTMSASAPSVPATPTALPAWLAGGWSTQSDKGAWSEEWWTPPRAGLMLGGGRSGKGDQLEWWEQTRIEQTGATISFCALPKGQEAACFTATSVTANAIVFENPKHDFPTRIAYQRAGDQLLAEVSGPAGANRQRWKFKRIG